MVTEATASMLLWMIVRHEGQDCLFGFADRHPNTGGLSWVLSTPIIDLDDRNGRALTASGRHYVLGSRITVDDLDEEGRLAWSLCVTNLRKTDVGPCDLAWLTACKMARHLHVSIPSRSDCEAVEQFLDLHIARYRLQRAGKRRH